REIDIWKRLRHPHILPFFGACSIADPPFAISALKQADASSYLRSNPDADRIQIILEAILGLIYLHEHSVVHGDLKASNILIDERGVACLADFGLSKLRMHTTTIRSRSTGRMGTGTSRWMSPEQMCLGIINRKTDIYSLAMTIYEASAT
ncbi:kinase-like protein, partial [Punctularia strigosozonata HHB-11173 SS5]|uniref:kinase-like protein n=1 Tax=Punctularia strigosozonata (strain HHB-11173) TaxID=741275 RepID=UPI0004417EE6